MLGLEQRFLAKESLKSKISNFDYRLEVTGQSEVDGHQWDLELGYTVNQITQSRIVAEIFSSSKDYIQLFPTAHKWLGILVLGRRIHDNQAALTGLPAKVAAKTGIGTGRRQHAGGQVCPSKCSGSLRQYLIQPKLHLLLS